MSEVIEAPSQLAKIVEQNGIAATNARTLVETFQPYFGRADELCAAAVSVKVTDATQVSEIKKSRELRLQIKALRVEAEKSRKTLKEDSLRMGKAIDGINNVLLLQIEPVEKHLEDQEKFAERAEAARKEQLRIARSAALAPYLPDQTAYALGEMTEPAFAQLLEGSRLAHEAKIAAEKKAEADRIAAEEARKAEEARIRAENERLRQEKEAAEAEARKERAEAEKKAKEAEEKARKEREAIEAEARKEREARERIEAENRAREEAEAKRVAAEAAQKRKAEAAPDKAKLTAFAAHVRTMDLPNVKAPEATAIVKQINTTLNELAKWIDAEAAKF
jgi:hypothetical protein